MSGERDLSRLLAGLRPRRLPGAFAVAVAPGGGVPAGLRPFATVREDEGLTLVLPREQADGAGLAYDYVAALITLQVHSDLAAVGLTAAVSGRLAAAGISCNVLAGARHDHLLVPLDRAAEAVHLLTGPGGAPPRDEVELRAELAAIRRSYDTVAHDYAQLLRDALAASPYDRAVLGLFTEAVAAGGGGPVADVGCGPGRVTAHLAAAGTDVFGIDLSPAMIGVARRDHPGLRFQVGSMTQLPLAGSSLAGLLAWYSLIHLPDAVLPEVLAHFSRVLRPGGLALLAFQVGDESRLKTAGYGGHPMRLHVHLRPAERVAALLEQAGLAVESRLVRAPGPGEGAPQAYLLARRSG